MITIDGNQLRADLQTLREFGRGPDGGITRKALSQEDAAARTYVKERARKLGLEILHDEVGNLIMRRPGTGAAVMTGSHLDTVPSGGYLDGPLGVVGALAAVAAIAKEKTTRPIEIAVFVGEEGSRFKRGTIGSAAMSGHVSVADVLALTDGDGITYKDAMRNYGDSGAPIPAQRTAKDVAAFVELHVEQGGILEHDKIAIGAVTAIAGLVQRNVRFIGDANHAGATPMPLRKDALLAASEWALQLEEIAKALGVVATVGKLEVFPSGKNIIPGRVEAICDLRATDGAILSALDERAVLALEQAKKRGVKVEESLLQRVNPGPMHEPVIAAVERGARAAGLSVKRMTSGAIHDALHMAEFCPASMIFVPSIGGKSHCPEEETAPLQLEHGCLALAHTLLDLANR